MTQTVPRPQEPDQIDGLVERLHGLARRPPRPAEVRDQVGQAAGAEAELEAAAAQHVERCRGLGHHGGRAQRQVRHVGEERNALGLGDQRRYQRPGVEEVPLVGVILDADEVEPGFIGHAHQFAYAIELLGCRHERDTESDGALRAVGCHWARTYPLRPPRTGRGWVPDILLVFAARRDWRAAEG
jgi:hypothetical protein